MGFHSNLSSQDLHAPSRLPIANESASGTAIQAKGFAAVVRYASTTGRYGAIPISEFAAFTGGKTLIFGIADENIISGGTGNIVTFGISEGVEVTGVTVTDVGRTVYLHTNGALTGQLVLVQTTTTIPVATVVNAGNGVADIFVFSLESGFERSQIDDKSLIALYDPNSPTVNVNLLPQDPAAGVVASGKVISPGDYFLITTDLVFPTTPNVFNRSLTRGDLIVATTPAGTNSPATAGATGWTIDDYAFNSASGSGSGFDLFVNTGGQLSQTVDFVSTSTTNEYGIDFAREGLVNVNANIGTTLEGKIRRNPDPAPPGGTALTTGEYVLNVDTTQSTPETIYTWRDLIVAGADDKLEINVLNSSGAELLTGRAYQILSNNISTDRETVTITSATVTAGSTSLVYLDNPTPIADGETGRGILKGIVRHTSGGGAGEDIDVAINANGGFNSTFRENNYVIGTILSNGSADNNVDVLFDGLSNNRIISEASRLTATVVNNSGATLEANRAYSLENDTYNADTNTINFNFGTHTGTVTAGQTGLIWIETAILDGGTGTGVLKGVIDTGVPEIIGELEFSINALGTQNTLPLDGEYIVGVTLKSTSATTNVELAFDGLSNYQLRREGRLECDVQNNHDTTVTNPIVLEANRAYSLTNAVYNPGLNLVTLSDGKPGDVIEGQTGLFWLEENIPAGESGKGVLKGIISQTITPAATVIEEGYKILSTGLLSSADLDDTYVVATSLSNSAASTLVEYVFDGLSSAEINGPEQYDSSRTYAINDQVFFEERVWIASALPGSIAPPNEPWRLPVTSVGGGGTVTNVTGIAPINVTSNDSTPEITITAADASLRGTMSPTDFLLAAASPPLWDFTRDVTANLNIDDQRVFGNKLYINLTGMSAGNTNPEADQPNNDTVNWREVGVGTGDGRVESYSDVGGGESLRGQTGNPVVGSDISFKTLGTNAENSIILDTTTTAGLIDISVTNPFTDADELQLDALPPLWTAALAPTVGDEVSFDGKIYINLTGTNNTGSAPTEPDWSMLRSLPIPSNETFLQAVTLANGAGNTTNFGLSKTFSSINNNTTTNTTGNIEIGDLQVNIVNNASASTGSSTITGGRFWSFETSEYDADTNTLTFINSLNSPHTFGDTGLVWVPTAIPLNSTGTGILRGIMQGTFPGLNLPDPAAFTTSAPVPITVTGDGFFSTNISAGNYVIGISLPRHNGIGGIPPKKIAFDGLSTTVFSAASDFDIDGQITNRLNTDTATAGLSTSGDGVSVELTQREGNTTQNGYFPTASAIDIDDNKNFVTASLREFKTGTGENYVIGERVFFDKKIFTALEAITNAAEGPDAPGAPWIRLQNLPVPSSPAAGFLQAVTLANGGTDYGLDRVISSINNNTTTNTTGNIEIGDLEVNVVNNATSSTGTSTLAGGRFHSLQTTAYDVATNTVTFENSLVEPHTFGTTGLVYLPNAIALNQSGRGVIRGILEINFGPLPGTNTSSQSVAYTVDGNGNFQVAGVNNYIIGVTLPGYDGIGPAPSRKIAFDGMSSNTVPATALTFNYVEDVTVNSATDKVIFNSRVGTNTTVQQFFGSPLDVPPAPPTGGTGTAINYVLQRNINQNIQSGLVLGFPQDSIPADPPSGASGALRISPFSTVPTAFGGLSVHIAENTNNTGFVAVKDAGTSLATGTAIERGNPVLDQIGTTPSATPIRLFIGGSGTVGDTLSFSDFLDDYVLGHNFYFDRLNVPTRVVRLPNVETTNGTEGRIGFFSTSFSTNLTPVTALNTAVGLFANVNIVSDNERTTPAATWVPSSGEANTNSNAEVVGTNEAGLVNAKVIFDTPIKTIKGGSNVTVTNDDTSVTISSFAGGTGTITSYSDAANTNAVSLRTGQTPGTTFSPTNGDLPFKTISGFGKTEALGTDTNAIIRLNDVTDGQLTAAPKAYSSTTAYTAGELIFLGEVIYEARVNVTGGGGPTLDNTSWSLFAPLQSFGFNVNYVMNDQVIFQNKLYVCVVATSSGVNPTSTTPANWEELGLIGEANTASNAVTPITGEAGLVNAKIDVDLPFKILKPGANIALTSDATSVTIAATGSASGEVNTLDNAQTPAGVPTEVGLMATKIAPSLRVKTVKAGTNITLAMDDDSITINATGGGGGTTTTTTSFTNRDSDFRSTGGSRLTQSLNFNVDNDGFIWDLNRLVTITAIDGAPVNLPIIPPPAIVLADITNFSATINGMAAVVVPSVSTSGGTDSIITFTHTGQIINTDVNMNTTYVLEVIFTLGGIVHTINSGVIGGDLTYNAHPFPTVTLAATAVNFQNEITTVTVTNRNPTPVANSVVVLATVFGGATFTPPGTNTFNNLTLTKDSNVTSRTLDETTEFFAAAGNDSNQSGSSTTLNIDNLFQFPVYLGSVSNRSEVNTAALNNSAIFNQSGAFTADPLSTTPQSFVWNDVSGPIKIFAIARRFTNDRALVFKDTATDPLGNRQLPFAQIAAGVTNTEIYDIYEAKTGQPGPATLFVENA